MSFYNVLEDTGKPTTPVPVTDKPCETPTITKFSSHVIREIGLRHTKLRCRATGYPEPTIVWSPIKDKRRLVDNNQGTMTIKTARAEDTGVYKCTASNECGHDSIETVLSIIPK